MMENVMQEMSGALFSVEHNVDVVEEFMNLDMWR